MTETVTRPHLAMAMKTARGQNTHDFNWVRRASRVKREKEDTAWYLAKYRRTHGKPTVPCSVLLTRVAPSNGLDDDNLTGALKNIRDAVAEWLGVDDRDRDTVRYSYAQRRGLWAVEIAFGPPVKGAQLTLEVMR
jgi:hypothetical protein